MIDVAKLTRKLTFSLTEVNMSVNIVAGSTDSGG